MLYKGRNYQRLLIQYERMNAAGRSSILYRMYNIITGLFLHTKEFLNIWSGVDLNMQLIQGSNAINFPFIQAMKTSLRKFKIFDLYH